MKSLAVLGTLIVLFQAVFSFYQIKYYNYFIRNIIRKHENKTDYRLDTEIVKKMFGSMVILVVTDKDNVVIESFYYRGFTVFSKFRKFNELNGRKLNKYVLTHIGSEKSKLKRQAIERLINKKMETVTT